MSTFSFLFLCIQACLLLNAANASCGCNGAYGPGIGGLGLAGLGAPYGLGAAGLAGPYGSAAGLAGLNGLAGPAALAGPYGLGAGPSAYGGSGYGNVAVSGELPVGGATSVAGQVPIIGAVEYTGCVPAAGVVTIQGNCAGSCGCERSWIY